MRNFTYTDSYLQSRQNCFQLKQNLCRYTMLKEKKNNKQTNVVFCVVFCLFNSCWNNFVHLLHLFSCIVPYFVIYWHGLTETIIFFFATVNSDHKNLVLSYYILYYKNNVSKNPKKQRDFNRSLSKLTVVNSSQNYVNSFINK